MTKTDLSTPIYKIVDFFVNMVYNRIILSKGGVYMELSDRVRMRREALGMSQEELAMRMGYSSRTSINKIENGRPCSQKIIARLAEALNVSIPYLMGWEEKEENPTAIDDGISEVKRELIDCIKKLPEDKVRMLLQVARSIR